jgi:hypothetical protein
LRPGVRPYIEATSVLSVSPWLFGFTIEPDFAAGRGAAEHGQPTHGVHQGSKLVVVRADSPVQFRQLGGEDFVIHQ